MKCRTEGWTKKDKNRDIGGFALMLVVIGFLPYLYETFCIPVNLVLVSFAYGLLMMLVTFFTRG
ncbi:hypothetical protein [Halobacillus litoralis]|uniref:hypothetical protein n=1 Tax=Halobacillus litoralis TaxID=45668 RepID=UPI001369DFBA|nr:hypothetical protein [Halobacillus litoralis]MYL39100.1 hypothetical protein [Halobacillus litoralis]